MSNIIINTKKSTIEMNKTFSAAASRFGTREYDQNRPKYAWFAGCWACPKAPRNW